MIDACSKCSKYVHRVAKLVTLIKKKELVTLKEPKREINKNIVMFTISRGTPYFLDLKYFLSNGSIEGVIWGTYEQRIWLMWIRMVTSLVVHCSLAGILYSCDNEFHIVGQGWSPLILHQKESRIAFYEVSCSKNKFCVGWCNLKAWAA